MYNHLLKDYLLEKKGIAFEKQDVTSIMIDGPVIKYKIEQDNKFVKFGEADLWDVMMYMYENSNNKK